MVGREWTLGRRSLRGLALGLFAALVMVLGLCPAVALADDVEVEPVGGEEPTLTTQGDPVLTPQDDYYPLYIGGKLVPATNPSGTGWSYDAASNTLTLNNYGAGVDLAAVGINYFGDKELTIVVDGDNIVQGGYVGKIPSCRKLVVS